MKQCYITGLVTVGMPVFNDKEFIEKSLNSILNQTYKNFELIISDDGSTDGSELICEEYCRRDSRITYLRQKNNLGISRNMKYLLDMAKGEYFMWAGDDDLYENTFVEKAIYAFSGNPEFIVAFPGYAVINEEDKIINKKIRHYNFNHKYPFFRLLKLSYFWDDGFGYGLFKTDLIKDVIFPVWKGRNKECAYGNIFPTLYFYLSKGNYAVSSKEILFYKRKKTPKKINHSRPFDQSYLRGVFFEELRYLNMYVMILEMIYKGRKNIILTIIIAPLIFLRILFQLFLVIMWNTKWLLQGRKKFY